MGATGRTFLTAAVAALALLSTFLAVPSEAHEGFVFTDNGIDFGTPQSEWRRPAILRVGSATAPAIADEYLYERHAAVWDGATGRLLTMGGGMTCCREYEERDVAGNLVSFEVFDQGQLPYRIEQIDTMGPRRVIGLGWGPNFPDDFRLFTFLREDPVGTLRTVDVLDEPTGMSCVGGGRIAVTHVDGTGFVRERGRGRVPFVVPMHALWSSFDGVRLWMTGDGLVGFVPNVADAPGDWECVLAESPWGIFPSRVVSLEDGHTLVTGSWGALAFIGEELTTVLRLGSDGAPSNPLAAIGPDHRLWISRVTEHPVIDNSGRLLIFDWFATEPAVEVTLPGKVEAIAPFAVAHEHGS